MSWTNAAAKYIADRDKLFQKQNMWTNSSIFSLLFFGFIFILSQMHVKATSGKKRFLIL